MKKKLLALGLAVVSVATLVVFHSRLAGDFWPPDRSFVGPNLIASVIQWALITILVVLVWPLIQRERAKEKERRLKEIREIHNSLTAMHEKLDDHAQTLEDIKKHTV